MAQSLSKKENHKLPRPERPRYSPSSLHERADTPILGSMYSLFRIHPLSQTRRRTASEYKISIIIPSFNEAKTLPKILKKVLDLKLPFKKELIIVDDGSTDETPKVLKKYSKNKTIKIIINSENLGKGASIKKALKQAKGDIILIQDADLEYNPQDIPNLLEPFIRSSAKVVYGSRILKKNPGSHWTFSLGGRLLTLITNILYGAGITDEATGYKLFRREVITSLTLKSKGFEFCPEITAKIAKRGIKIVEVPISYNPRIISEKKIKWWDGFKAIYYLFKYRLID